VHAFADGRRCRVVDNRGERVDLEGEQFDGVLRQRSAGGDDHRVRIADVAHFVVGQHLVRAVVGAPAHLQDRCGAHRAGEKVVEVGRRQDRDDAGRGPGGGGVDTHQPAAGDVAAGEGNMEHARDGQVVDVAPAAREEAGVLLPVDPAPHEPAGRGEHAHRRASGVTGSPVPRDVGQRERRELTAG
jgi:hypothetical protein